MGHILHASANAQRLLICTLLSGTVYYVAISEQKPPPKYHHLTTFLILGHSVPTPLLPITAKFGTQEPACGVLLHAKFCWAWPTFYGITTYNHTNLTNFQSFQRGAHLPTNVTDQSQIRHTRIPAVMLKCQIRSKLFIQSQLMAKTPKFYRIFNYDILWWSSWWCTDKVTSTAKLQTFHYPTTSKSFPFSNDICAKWLAQATSFKSVTDQQTNKQTNKP